MSDFSQTSASPRYSTGYDAVAQRLVETAEGIGRRQIARGAPIGVGTAGAAA